MGTKKTNTAKTQKVSNFKEHENLHERRKVTMIDSLAHITILIVIIL